MFLQSLDSAVTRLSSLHQQNGTPSLQYSQFNPLCCSRTTSRVILKL